jgi:membrane fusion protein (multidrug efflux system)
MSKNNRLLRAGLWPIGLAVLAAGTACGKQKPAAAAPQGPGAPLQVAAVVLEPRALENSIYIVGTLLPNEEVELRPEASGRITDLSFREGQSVAAGQALLKINDRDLRAQLEKARLQARLYEDDVRRKKQLLELRSISQEELEVAENQLAIARSEMELIEAQIEKTLLKAPFSGKIGLSDISVGSYVTPSTAIAMLQQLDPVRVEFSVPEKYAARIQAGQQVAFTLTESETSYRAQVYAVESQIDPATRSIKVRARCANPGGRLKPGAFARVSLILDRNAQALLIPSEALFSDIEGEKVFLYRQGRASLTAVRTGFRGEETIEITGGLAAGDTVITTGLLQLRPDAPVGVRITELPPLPAREPASTH